MIESTVCRTAPFTLTRIPLKLRMASMKRIPVAGPWITQKEIDYVTDAVTNAWYGSANLYHERFEKALATYVGRQYAMALPSCTAGLHLALAALGIGPGDEVIVPDITWIASAAPIHYVGATAVFADIDPHSWCLSPEAFAACITPRTKAVIIVDLYGNMPDMDGLLTIAKRHDIAVIEDAAEAMGSEYNGKRAGSFGDIGTFSFHGSKTLTTGEGGMLLTDRADLYERCLCLRDHGRTPGEKMFWNGEVAFKYKMSAMQAALGLAQTERLDALVAHKRLQFEWYHAQLGDMNELTLNNEALGVKNTYWMVTALVNPSLKLEKEALIKQLSEKGIDTRPFFYPLSSLPAYQHLETAHTAQKNNRVAYALAPYGLNLPSAFSVSEADVRYISDSLKDILRKDATHI
jgi:perosamine synthetase